VEYLLLANEAPDDYAAREDPARAEGYWAGWTGYLAALADAGVLRAAGGLHPPSTATTLRLREGQRLLQDGPFAETKEQLGGYFVLDVPDLDAALAWAARCPSATTGSVEVRPQLAMPPDG
jgi:hypothetical protein